MELTQAEKKRAKKLEELLAKLKNGEHVQNRTLKTWLTDDEYTAMEKSWVEQRKLREELKDKPDEIIEYETRLRLALLASNKADGYSSRGCHDAAYKARNKADGCFERVWEYLQEILDVNPSLQSWFDRTLDFSVRGDMGLDPVSVPRVATSRSLDCQSNHFSVQTKNEVKQRTVESALDAIYSGPPLRQEEMYEMQQEKLKRLKSE